MFQCPGCKEYIEIRAVRENATPVPYELSEGGNLVRHKCKSLKALQKEVADMKVDPTDPIFDEFLVDDGNLKNYGF